MKTKKGIHHQDGCLSFYLAILFLVSISFLLPHPVEDGHEDNLDVQHESPVLYIPNVFLDTLLHHPSLWSFTSETLDLRPSCDARLYEMAHHVLVDNLTVFLGMLQHVWTGTHNGHVVPKHVDELREFINAGLAQEITPLGLTRIILGGLNQVGLVIDLHAAELQTGELFAVVTTAFLLEEYRARHGNLGDISSTYSTVIRRFRKLFTFGTV